MNQNLTLKPPAHCTIEELTAFEAALIAAGETASPALVERVCRADALVMICDAAGAVTGTGALKSPKEEHCAAIFRKVGAAVPPDRYTLELGWLTGPDENFPAIVAALTHHAAERPVFAVTQTDAPAVAAALAAHGFRTEGSAWPSPRGPYTNQLHLRDA